MAVVVGWYTGSYLVAKVRVYGFSCNADVYRVGARKLGDANDEAKRVVGLVGDDDRVVSHRVIGPVVGARDAELRI